MASFGNAGRRPGFHPAYYSGAGQTHTGVGGAYTAGRTPPAAHADPYVPGPQVDQALVAQQNAANYQIATGNATDAYQAGQINNQYGNLGDPAADLATNPFSQAALLQQSYQDSQHRDLTGFAARGGLYSGALQHQTELDTTRFGQQVAAAKRSRQHALDQIALGALGRYGQVGATQNADQVASLLRGLGNS